MKREAVLHIPMSEYAYGVDDSHYVFRLRTAKGDIKECNFYYGDTACRQNPIVFIKAPMNAVASDEYFDYYEVEMECIYHRLYYYFELKDGTESLYYYADFFRKELAEDRSEYYKLPFNRREDLIRVPDWVKEAVIYNIFPDSFATGHCYLSQKGEIKSFRGKVTKGRLGGTVRGITENAGYLEELGINCIYINPLFAAGEYHKYDTIDYKTIDPCFGTNEEFREMVQILHGKGIRVIIDGVFNHCGWEFPYFEDVVAKGEQSAYTNWFYQLSYPVVKPDNTEDIPGYECFAYERMMPKLNTSAPEVAAYLLDVGVYWVKEYDIDGWRLDVASEVNDDFWRAFRKAVKEVKPDSFIIGEVWETARHWLDGSQFDSAMNYDMRKYSRYFFAQKEIDAAQFDARVTNMRMRYRKNTLLAQLNLLDSHDVSRFLTVCGENMAAWKLAVLFQMFFQGIPSIFYGDEQRLTGHTEDEYRRGMEWDTTQEAFIFYKRAIALRRSSKVWWEGSYRTLTAKAGSMLYGFAREWGAEAYHIYLNAGLEQVKITQEGGLPIWQGGLRQGNLDGLGFAIYQTNAYN